MNKYDIQRRLRLSNKFGPYIVFNDNKYNVTHLHKDWYTLLEHKNHLLYFVEPEDGDFFQFHYVKKLSFETIDEMLQDDKFMLITLVHENADLYLLEMFKAIVKGQKTNESVI